MVSQRYRGACQRYDTAIAVAAGVVDSFPAIAPPPLPSRHRLLQSSLLPIIAVPFKLRPESYSDGKNLPFSSPAVRPEAKSQSPTSLPSRTTRSLLPCRIATTARVRTIWCGVILGKAGNLRTVIRTNVYSRGRCQPTKLARGARSGARRRTRHLSLHADISSAGRFRGNATTSAGASLPPANWRSTTGKSFSGMSRRSVNRRQTA